MAIWRKFKTVLKWLALAILFLLCAALLWAGALQLQPVRTALAGESLVQTDTGWVQGWRLPGRSIFLGIPYAQAPVGDLRWAAPQPAKQWDGARMALLPKAICAQPAVPELRVPQSLAEDCLGLNIFKPVNHTGKPLPVMLWIHGGGFVLGSGNFTLASDLAERGQVMVVAINYRLGALGFLAHPALGVEDGQAVGNYGLLDQQMAINWVKRNAAAFGGDANNITIFGQSAGGTSVCAQLMSPAMAGQFQAAIIQSGVCSSNLMQSMPDALRLGETLVQKLPCQGQGRALLACLRALPVDQLLPLLGHVGATSEVPLRPVYGSTVLPDAPDMAWTQGHFHRVPLLIGSTRDEGTLLVALGINQINHRRPQPLNAAQLQAQDTPAAFSQSVSQYFGAAALPALQARYPLARYGGKGSAALAAMLTDSLFACNADSLRRSAVAQKLPVYGYEFATAPAGGLIKNDISGVQLGAYHGAEFASLFFYPFYRLDAQQQLLADDMKDYWAGFARHHQPVAGRKGAAAWPAFTAEQPQLLSLRAEGSVMVDDFAQRHQCDFWQSQDAPASVAGNPNR
jgi:para-nitrobenzyl esterase